MYKILTIKWKQLLVHIWTNTETNGKQQLDNTIRIGSMASFKFCMGDKLEEKMEGGERDEKFFSAL